MSDPVLQKIILQRNPQKIQRYIKSHLSDNPENLERIYRQLESLGQSLNEIIEKNGQTSKKPLIFSQKKSILQRQKGDLTHSIIKRHSSLRQIKNKRVEKKSQDYFQRNKQQNITKRHETLIRNLKEKGLRPNSQELSFGMKVLQQKQKRISKPLQSNPTVVFKQSSSVIKCIKKFNLNKNFYSNAIEDAQVDAQRYFDRQMKAFLDRRQQSLSIITAKKQFQCNKKHPNSRKFSHVQSRFGDKSAATSMSLGLQTAKKGQTERKDQIGWKSLPTNIQTEQQKTNPMTDYKKKKQAQAEFLVKYCTNVLQQIPDYRPKSLLGQNIKFKRLRQRTAEVIEKMSTIYKQLQNQKQQFADNRLQINQLAANYGKNKQIQKYTLSYLKSIKTKSKNNVILTNRNDLIKNESKFRNLIAGKVD